MRIDIFITPSNSYLSYILSQCNPNYNIVQLESSRDLYNMNLASILPIILCDNDQEFLSLKATIYKEKLILISQNQKLLWKYQIINPFKVDQLLSLINNISFKIIFQIKDQLLFEYNRAELIHNQSYRFSLTSVEADILYEIIINKPNCTKNLLISRIWPKHDIEHANKNLDNYIYKLRKKLELFNLFIEIDNKINTSYYVLT